jgi:hypothetical protein
MFYNDRTNLVCKMLHAGQTYNMLDIGVVIKPACKPIFMVAAFLSGPEVSTS